MKNPGIIFCASFLWDYHWISIKIFEMSKAVRREVIDAPCPFVRKVQDIAESLDRKNYQNVVKSIRNGL